MCVAVNKRSVFYDYRAAMGEGNMGYGKWICIPPNMDPDEEEKHKGGDVINISLKSFKEL